MSHTIKAKRPEDLTEEERETLRKSLTKQAIEIKAPTNSYLEGKKAKDYKPRFKEVKGGNNDFIARIMRGK